MHILVTGANGFVGAHLVARLVSAPSALAWTRLTLVDLQLPAYDSPGISYLAGSLADPQVLEAALAVPVDVAFHLASVPGGAAERDYELGRQVNLQATLALFEQLQQQANPARVVFASTIAVYGSPLPAVVDDETPLRPGLSYGAQKLIGEILLEDLSRRGRLDGIALRLPGIVARPPQSSGLLSAFMSDLFWKLRDGEPFVCPVSAEGTAWWMSVQCCVDNLLHGALIPAQSLHLKRVFALPVLHLTLAEVIEGVNRYAGFTSPPKVQYQLNPVLQSTFASYPPLASPAAQALGFIHDGSLEQLIRRTLGPAQEASPVG
ncbi:NAD-dependent epimerase/dehydratase family protein [Pseudomonas sp. App30]|uniref:NAD-dependent epimerase/dehydratase family protein n=1 Tax=Pseudomonas sp. App30 TaxID=3068990 RepID=UPI003A80F60E